MNTTPRWIQCAALTAGLLAGGSAAAQGTWNLGGASCNAGGTPGVASCAMGSVTAAMSAYSNVTHNDGSPTPTFKQINLGNNDPSGFGAMNAAGTGGDQYVAESGSPDHAFDNMMTGSASGREGGSQEFMLINFGNSKVNLSSLQIGWTNDMNGGSPGTPGDADMSIYRWDGNAVNVAGTALASGWKLVSSMDAYNNGSACTNPNGGSCKQFDAGSGLVADSLNKYSSWWLISTYVGSATSNGLDGNKTDSFKLLSFTGGLCAQTLSGGSTGGGSTQNNGNGATCGGSNLSVSEPGSLALAGLAITGVYGLRRRKLTPVAA